MFNNSKLKAQVAELALELEQNRFRHLRDIEKLADRLHKSEKLVDRLHKSERMRHLEPEMVEVKTLVGLKFDALYKGTYIPAVFTTGLGKCGKTVKSFHISKSDRTLTIRQHHTDGSSKDFEYRLSDIDGRIQYDYEMTKVPRSEVIEFRGTRFIKPTL